MLVTHAGQRYRRAARELSTGMETPQEFYAGAFTWFTSKPVFPIFQAFELFRTMKTRHSSGYHRKTPGAHDS